jgi:hypothetical protein
MSREDALNLAAWLVALAETPDSEPKFIQVFHAITEGERGTWSAEIGDRR